jgi:hypothetical protein
MEPQSGIRPWQWIVTIIVIIALIVVGIMVFRNKNTQDTTPVDDTNIVVDTDTNTDDTPETDTNRIVINDQFPGNVVHISSVQLAKNGWVVIQKDSSGKPGEVIGSAYFEKGINPGKITLSKPTVDGGIYYAVLYVDDGDKKFDPAKDTQVKNSRGSVVMKVFKAGENTEPGFKG